ncbi:Phragmoplast-associated kinesin-related protein, putative isoform 2 [Hibiscus syriacus]|uniref:Phragmoplast-associated kinesin-related protein, putative isoform 2 n=1 Tax=Hibiscus syriacus TaxID=106335 RepID=A0A6A2ZLG4_HIBSY|nr:Phragmoplast-associated kinesin-related protein, putative isoform 2 [Hibiscus syriacus]
MAGSLTGSMAGSLTGPVLKTMAEGYSTVWNARRSLNLLKFSLNHPRALSHVDEDGDEEMEIDEETVENLCAQVGTATSESGCVGDPGINASECGKAQNVEDQHIEEGIFDEPKTSESMIVDCVEPATNTPNIITVHDSVKKNPIHLTIETTDEDSSVILKSPTSGISPKVNQSRKSLRTSSVLTASQKEAKDDGPEAMRVSFTPTELLAASLHRGLEVIGQSLALRRSSYRFSLKPADSKPTLAAFKVDVGIQTFPQDYEIQGEEYLCTNCKQRKNLEGEYIDESSNLQSVLFNESEASEKTKKQVPKAVEKVLAGSIRREMALEEFCAKQASEIMQLNRLGGYLVIVPAANRGLLFQPYGCVLPTEEFLEEELASLIQEHKLLKEKCENHPEDLRNQLQYYIDSSTLAQRQNSLLQLTFSCDLNAIPPLSAIPEINLEERHVQLLARHRQIQEGIDDVKMAAARAVHKGKRRDDIFSDENKGLQAQLRDTSEAVQAAGELLERLKEAEEAVAAAQKRAMEAEQETEKARKKIDKLKRKHEREISTLNKLLAESRLPKDAIPPYDKFDIPKYDASEVHDASDQRRREEFEPFYNGEDGELSSKHAENSSWFFGYDRCNI